VNPLPSAGLGAMHGGGDVRTVGEKLHGKMPRQGGAAGGLIAFAPDNAASGVGPWPISARAILLEVRVRRYAGLRV